MRACGINGVLMNSSVTNEIPSPPEIIEDAVTKERDVREIRRGERLALLLSGAIVSTLFGDSFFKSTMTWKEEILSRDEAFLAFQKLSIGTCRVIKARGAFYAPTSETHPRRLNSSDRMKLQLFHYQESWWNYPIERLTLSNIFSILRK